MGCAINSLSSDEYNSFLGIYIVYKRDFDAMGFGKNQMKQLFKLYLEIEGEQYESIPIVKIAQFFSLSDSSLLLRLLNRADEQGKSTLSFNNMVVALWNLCSLADQFIGKF